MKKLVLLTSLFTTFILSAQGNYETVITEAILNYDSTKIDSIAKTLGYKSGDIIETLVKFGVTHEGKTVNVTAEAPHEAFSKESVKIIEGLSKLDLGITIDKEKPIRLKLPINFQVDAHKQQTN
ncbi:hypothetical protein [Tenacibaculum sp. 190524A02b]|uniref:TonB_C domain-containing protein n=1 Tax=Tenacibaculum vairaonense TaxID=3137860 RepID=A0ABM9PHE2_9FLAO